MIKYHDSYFTNIEWEPEPHLEYTFYTETDTVFYTNLDSIITHYYQWVNYDTNFFSYYVYDTVMSSYCDSVINGFYYATNYFEPDIYSRSFGKGLGRVKVYMYSGSAPQPGVQYHRELFYYQKNGIECGIPDLTTVAVKELSNTKSNISLSPNPATEYFQINMDYSGSCLMQMYSSAGKLIKSKKINRDNAIIDCRSFSPGLYIISLSDKKGNQLKKLIVE